MFVYILNQDMGKQGYDSLWFFSSSLCYDNFCTKTGTHEKITYSRIPKNTEKQKKNTKENTRKTIEINWD